MPELTGAFRTVPSTASKQELDAYARLYELFDEMPIPPDEVLANLELFQSRAAMGRILFMHSLYEKILDVHGIVIEFGVRWGRNLALFSTFRNVYEPHNYSRKIVGFDTFGGFPDDGEAEAGAFAVPVGYESYLTDILTAHERLAPRSHQQRFELVKGDVCKTLPQYLDEHPETIIALAYFDLDLYAPTYDCLTTIVPYLTKGSIVGFDNLLLPPFPGETKALRHAWGPSVCLKRDVRSNFAAYTVWKANGFPAD